jgi:hypothetical protein
MRALCSKRTVKDAMKRAHDGFAVPKDLEVKNGDESDWDKFWDENSSNKTLV